MSFARDQIVDLQPLDPASFVLATTVLMIVAAGAAWLPRCAPHVSIR